MIKIDGKWGNYRDGWETGYQYALTNVLGWLDNRTLTHSCDTFYNVNYDELTTALKGMLERSKLKQKASQRTLDHLKRGET